jgi:hypothetical protein
MRNNRNTKYLLAVEAFGAVMFAVVCLAYILGLPSNSVLHGEVAFRVVIGFFGSVFFVGSIAVLIAAYVAKSRTSA